MHGLLASRMTGFAVSRDWVLLAAMLPKGIAFGAVHALTPGHGKSVPASYLVGSPLPVLRSLLAASVQATRHVGGGQRLLVAARGAPMPIKLTRLAPSPSRFSNAAPNFHRSARLAGKAGHVGGDRSLRRYRRIQPRIEALHENTRKRTRYHSAFKPSRQLTFLPSA